MSNLEISDDTGSKLKSVTKNWRNSKRKFVVVLCIKSQKWRDHFPPFASRTRFVWLAYGSSSLSDFMSPKYRKTKICLISTANVVGILRMVEWVLLVRKMKFTWVMEELMRAWKSWTMLRTIYTTIYAFTRISFGLVFGYIIYEMISYEMTLIDIAKWHK